MLALVSLVRKGLNDVFVTKNIWPEADNTGRFLGLYQVIAVVLGELYVIRFVTDINILDYFLRRLLNRLLKVINKIKSIEGNTIEIANRKIPIGRNYVKVARERIFNSEDPQT
ncbi:hypothetical protein [Formosa sediminum]|uniref:hypothetical protein n=1 Tax=Formosa sediminum TaxID=2594004 RepID=UPI00163D52BD|nr:hypothetical protein [Formosa sediminum]